MIHSNGIVIEKIGSPVGYFFWKPLTNTVEIHGVGEFLAFEQRGLCEAALNDGNRIVQIRFCDTEDVPGSCSGGVIQ